MESLQRVANLFYAHSCLPADGCFPQGSVRVREKYEKCACQVSKYIVNICTLREKPFVDLLLWNAIFSKLKIRRIYTLFIKWHNLHSFVIVLLA